MRRLPLIALLATTLACHGQVEVEPSWRSAPPPDTPPPITKPPVMMPPVPGEPATPSYGESTVRLLTPAQYIATVEDLLGATPPGIGAYNSSLAAASGGLNTGLVEQYADAAFDLTTALFTDPARREALLNEHAPEACVDATTTCFKTALPSLGLQAWRRPMTQDETARYVALAEDVGTRLEDPWKGLAYAVAGLMQSPHFLYRVELGEADPQDPERLAYTGYEVATRLSFFLTNRPPSAALLEQARQGRLDTREGIEVAARALLTGPHGPGGVEALGVDLFGLDGILGVEKDEGTYPEFDAEVARAMRDQVARTFQSHVLEGRDYRDLYRRRDTFMNDTLAPLYDLEPTFGEELVTYTFTEDARRRGILMLAGLMALHSGIANTSPTNRGFFVRTDLLCHIVPPPGPDIDTTLPEPEPGERLTNRELLGRHVADPSCAGCHQFMDPVGFPLENFDPIGRWRESQNDKPIDASGALDGTDYADVLGFGEALADHPDLVRCATQKLFAHAFARLAQRDDRALIDDLLATLEAHDHDLREALIALATSDAMRFAKPPRTEDQP